MTFGALSKRRVPDDLFRSWLHPLRHNPKVRRDLNKYLRNVPKPQQLLKWADQQRTFTGPVLIVWARHDKLMPPTHAERLTEHFQNTQLVWIDDSRTLIPIDQPETLTDHVHTFPGDERVTLPAPDGWHNKPSLIPSDRRQSQKSSVHTATLTAAPLRCEQTDPC